MLSSETRARLVRGCSHLDQRGEGSLHFPLKSRDKGGSALLLNAE